MRTMELQSNTKRPAGGGRLEVDPKSVATYIKLSNEMRSVTMLQMKAMELSARIEGRLMPHPVSSGWCAARIASENAKEDASVTDFSRP